MSVDRSNPASTLTGKLVAALAALIVALVGTWFGSYLTTRAQTSEMRSDTTGLVRVYGLYLAQQADRLKYALIRDRRPELVASPLSAENLKILATSLPRESWEAVAKAEYAVTRTLGSPDPGSADRLLCEPSRIDGDFSIWNPRS